MAEERRHVQVFSYTYTYDRFIVFFYRGHVFLSGKELTIGHTVWI